MKCRKEKLVGKTVGYIALTGQTVTGNCLLVTDQPALRRQELYTGFYTEREKLPLRCAKSLTVVWKNPNQQKSVIQSILKEADA